MAANDPFASVYHGPAADVRNAITLTPDNSNDITTVTNGIYINGASAGNVDVMMVDGSASISLNLLARTFYPLRIKRLYTTTSVTVVGLY